MSSEANKQLGTSFDDFLEEEGLLESAEAAAHKRILAWQIARLMQDRHINKSELAKRMRTSRSALDRLLDPGNASVTLATLDRAANALGKRLKIEIVDAK
ncbi:MAG: helix-turn-helix transcriptional regulator [Rhodospirillales bacterium]|jgi:DNA-binding Xre family transcriptional regulator